MLSQKNLLLVLIGLVAWTISIVAQPLPPEKDPFALIGASGGIGSIYNCPITPGCGCFEDDVLTFSGEAFAANIDVFPMPYPYKIKGILSIHHGGSTYTRIAYSQVIDFSLITGLTACSCSNTNLFDDTFELIYDLSDLSLDTECNQGWVTGFTADITIYGYWVDNTPPGSAPPLFLSGDVAITNYMDCNEWWPSFCYDNQEDNVTYVDKCIQCRYNHDSPPPGGNSYVIHKGVQTVLGEASRDEGSITSNSDGVLIYPNPSSAYVNIIFNDKTVGGTMKLYGPRGRELKNWRIPENARSHKIDVNHIPPGLYSIVMYDKDSMVHIERFIRK